MLELQGDGASFSGVPVGATIDILFLMWNERGDASSMPQMLAGKRAEGRDDGWGCTSEEYKSSAAVETTANRLGENEQPFSTTITSQTININCPNKTLNSNLSYIYNNKQINEFTRIINKRRRSPRDYWQSVRTSRKLLKEARIAEVNNDADVRPYVDVRIKGNTIRGLLDSGASISCVGKDAYNTLQQLDIKWKEVKSEIQTASGQRQGVQGYADVPVTFKNITHSIRLYIIPTLSQPVYFGIDFWIAFELMPKLEEIELPKQDENNMHELTQVQIATLEKVKATFPACDKEGLGKTTLLQHRIDVGNATPIKHRYHAVSPAIQKKMFEEVDRMLELGVIEESLSPWSSPMTIVTKANGKFRLCLDARRINSLTTKDAYPTPLINGIISRLNETKFISSIDLKDAFWQVELEPSSREITAFTIPGRPLYHFTRMPFGLCNSGQSMCRLMDIVIPSAMRDFIFVYIDDLLVVASDFKTHIERLQLVSDCLRKANLTINVDKSKFCMSEIKYLGHVVGNGKIKPDPGRVKSIVEFPRPTTVRQVRRFMGMAGWYRKYINNFSDVAAPMTDLLKTTDRFTWTPEATVSFDELKKCLTTAPVLTHADFSLPFFIQCDASMLGVGGVLFQNKDGCEHPIAYYSKKLNPAQRNYSITELECLAAVLCIREFRCYIEGMRFTVITDHAALKWLMEKKDLAGRLARWSLELQAFNFSIEHRKGSTNLVPDALSRAIIEEMHPVGTPIDLNDDEFNGETYVELRNKINANKDNLPDVEERNGVLYKRTQCRTENGDETAWKIWVPDGLRKSIMEECHNPPSASHGGVDKTLELIRRQYFWPGMSSEIRSFVAKCSTCKETKSPSQTLRPLMGSPPIAHRPFQNLYIDLLGPYPRSKAGNAVILIVLDQLTKFVWLKPLRKATAITIVKYVESEIFHFVGAPESLLSDNGKQFVAKEFKNLLSSYGVKQVYTATHAPQINASERVNRSIIAAIRAYVDQDQTTWDVNISSIASALRNSVHSSTAKSPYYSVFGQHMIQHGAAYPLLRNLRALDSGEVEVLPPPELRCTLNRDVRNKLQLAQERNRRTYNLKAREVTFKPGQEVFRRSFVQSDATKNFNAKLSKQWLPARIVRKKGACLYDLEDRQGKQINVAYHAKDIRA